MGGGMVLGCKQGVWHSYSSPSGPPWTKRGDGKTPHFSAFPQGWGVSLRGTTETMQVAAPTGTPSCVQPLHKHREEKWAGGFPPEKDESVVQRVHSWSGSHGVRG